MKECECVKWDVVNATENNTICHSFKLLARNWPVCTDNVVLIQKGKKKTKSKNTKEESESEAQGGETEGATFSDDELPSDLDLGDDYFKEEQGAQGNGGSSSLTANLEIFKYGSHLNHYWNVNSMLT